MSTERGPAWTYAVHMSAEVRADIARLSSDPGEARDLFFALLEIAHGMGRDPFQGEPVAGALGIERGPLDAVWRLRFDVSRWESAPRFVLHYLPPNLSRPSQVVWVAVGLDR